MREPAPRGSMHSTISGKEILEITQKRQLLAHPCDLLCLLAQRLAVRFRSVSLESDVDALLLILQPAERVCGE